MSKAIINAISEASNDLEHIADKLDAALAEVEETDRAGAYATRIHALAQKGEDLWIELHEHQRRQPTYELSENQQKFVDDAEQQGLDVTYDYSGRGMCGSMCPSVVVGWPGDFGTKAATRIDSMGLNTVIYAEH